MSWRQRASTLAMAVVSIILFLDQEIALATIFGGFFVHGTGEWINHPSVDRPRKTNWPGMLLEIVGVALMLYGSYRVAQSLAFFQ